MIDVVYGSEGYLIKEKVQVIIAQYQEQHDLEVVMFNAKDHLFQFENVLEAAYTVSLFCSRKCICLIIDNDKDLIKVNEDQLHDFLSQKLDSVYFILVLPKPLAAKHRCKKLLDRVARRHEIKKASEQDFKNELNTHIQRYQIKISSSAQELLLKRIGSDRQRMINELEKLQVLGRQIGVEDVEQLVTESFEDHIFALSNAIIKRDVKQTFRIYHGFLAQKMDPLALLGLMGSSLRRTYQVSSLYATGLSSAMIAQTLGITDKQVYVIVNHQLQDPEVLLGYLNQLGKIDQDAKNGLIDRFVGFELFLLQVTT